jgi:alkylation response protein AidB-like acyl-CoA dehydrogenase
LEDTDHELRATARGFFEKYSSESAVREVMESDNGFDPALWRLMADQLGLQGLLVPEEFGGIGLGLVQTQGVMEEMGRALVCAPFLSSAVLSVTALLASGDRELGADLLTGISDGSTIAVLAFVDSQGRWDASNADVRADLTPDGWAVTGTKLYVLDAAVADVVLIAAATGEGLSLLAVDPRGPGCVVTPLETLDMTRRQATLALDAAPAKLIGQPGCADPWLQAALNSGLAALAAEQVGGARRLLEMSVEYAKVREQFGRAIGSFQAIKHKCADMLVEVESATSAAYAAGAAIDDSSTEAALLASLAKAYCSEAYSHAAAENIQVHGGIGFTWEHPAHLYFRRAKSTEMLLGGPAYHRERMLKELGL